MKSVKRLVVALFAAGVLLAGGIVGGTLGGVAYSQVRASTTTGTVTIRNIISGTLNFLGTSSLSLTNGTITVNGANTGATIADGLLLQNTTAATAGTQVQEPRVFRMCGTADNSSSGHVSETDCWRLEALPATAAGATSIALNLCRSVAGAAYTNCLQITSGGSFTIPSGASIILSSERIKSSANGLFQTIQNSLSSPGVEFNTGTAAPTLGTCTGGSLTSGSTNTSGEYTGNTSSSCVVTFGAPNWSNAPFCFAMSEASTTHPRISARSATAITVTGGVSGEAVQYFCVGRI